MILVDSSIWIDHFRFGETRLRELLEAESVLLHPYVLGELSLGGIKNRKQVLADLESLRRPLVALDDEVLAYIEAGKLYSTGIGFIDAHLLTSVKLMPGTKLWSRDRSLKAATQRLGVSYAEVLN